MKVWSYHLRSDVKKKRSINDQNDSGSIRRHVNVENEDAAEVLVWESFSRVSAEATQTTNTFI